jgi:hypothetical protein
MIGIEYPKPISLRFTSNHCSEILQLVKNIVIITNDYNLGARIFLLTSLPEYCRDY